MDSLPLHHSFPLLGSKFEADSGDRTFVQQYTAPPDPCQSDPDCINGGKQPLLKNIRRGLIDPDTPKSALTKQAADGTKLKLVVRKVE